MKSNKSKLGMGAAILGLAVGFAAVSTTLLINGTINITADTENFVDNVVFTEASLTGKGIETAITSTRTHLEATPKVGTVTNANADKVAISADGKSITFVTNEMNKIGDSTTLSYKIGNYSQYDAKDVKITCVKENEKQINAYYSITPSEADTVVADKIAAGEVMSEAKTVVLTQTKSYAGEASVTDGSKESISGTVTCTITTAAGEVEQTS